MEPVHFSQEKAAAVQSKQIYKHIYLSIYLFIHRATYLSIGRI